MFDLLGEERRILLEGLVIGFDLARPFDVRKGIFVPDKQVTILCDLSHDSLEVISHFGGITLEKASSAPYKQSVASECAGVRVIKFRGFSLGGLSLSQHFVIRWWWLWQERVDSVAPCVAGYMYRMYFAGSDSELFSSFE